MNQTVMSVPPIWAKKTYQTKAGSSEMIGCLSFKTCSCLELMKAPKLMSSTIMRLITRVVIVVTAMPAAFIMKPHYKSFLVFSLSVFSHMPTKAMAVMSKSNSTT